MASRVARVFAVVGFAAAVLGCAEATVIQGCEPADGVTPLCSVTNPEDLVAMPGGRWLITGEMPHPGAEPGIQGRLVAVRLADEHQQVLFPGSVAATPSRPAIVRRF